MENNSKRQLSRYQRFVICGLGIVVVFNLLGFIKPFDDFYTDHIYGIFADALGRVMNLLPFALGEIVMLLGIFIAVAGIIIAIILLICLKKEKVRRFAKRFYKSVSVAIIMTLIIYTFTWTIPFRAHELQPNKKAPKEFSNSYLRDLRNTVVLNLNQIAEDIERDSTGRPVQKNIEKDVVKAMKRFSKTFPRLSGYYPDMKQAIVTDFLEYMGIGGYTYPYTMELTNNKYISNLYYPVLYAHELSHHKGYYKESEAVFISCVTLLNSENKFLEYAALFEMYWYLEEAYEASVPEKYILIDPQMSDRVILDWQTAQDDIDAEFLKDSHLFENVKDIVENVGNVGWDVQEEVLTDEEEGVNYSYDGCVKLFLAFYYKEWKE